MTFIKENKIPLLVVLGVTVLFGAYLFFMFVIVQPGTFLSSLDGDIMIPSSAQEKQEKWTPALLTENFVSLFSSGVSLSAVAPDIGKIATHPSVKNYVEPLWPSFEIAIFVLNIALLGIVFKYSKESERGFIIFLTLAIGATISMVILARPDHNIVPDFDYRYAGPPYYFYCLFISLTTLVATRAKKEEVTRIILSVLFVILALQQIFSFHSVRLEAESKLRQGAIVALNKSLFPELEELAKKGPLVIANLTGAHIFQGMPGYTLADYLLFFNKKIPVHLIQNAYMPPDVKTHMVETVGSLRTRVSQTFIEALKKPGAIRLYYTSPVWMTCDMTKEQNTPATSPIALGKEKEILIRKSEFDPEKLNLVGFSFYTDNIPGNLEFSFFFKNDFGVNEKAGTIRIDDFTSYSLKDGKRFYHIETNMLQVYPYALSQTVSDFSLHVPEEKSPSVVEIYLK